MNGEDSPRKRVKLSPSRDGAGDSNEAPASTVPHQEAPKNAWFWTEGPSQKSQEIALGINEYINPDSAGFGGILKQRYTDFLVNEILPNGEVLHLSTLGAPRPPKPVPSVNDAASGAVQPRKPELAGVEVKEPDVADESQKKITPAKDETFSAPEAEGTEKPVNQAPKAPNGIQGDLGSLAAIIGSDTANEIQTMHEKVLTNPKAPPKSHGKVSVPLPADRQVRTSVHQLIRQLFNSALETATDIDKEVIDVTVASARSRAAQSNRSDAQTRQRPKNPFKELGGDFCHFTLYKQGRDTMEAINFLCRQQRLPVKTYQYAGTKDRRAVTVQRVSAYRVHADKIAHLNRDRNVKWAKVGDFSYSTYGLKLGDHKGNEFEITLRDCRLLANDKESMLPPASLDEEVQALRQTVDAAVDSINKTGFLNYYGLQRFGSFNVKTHEIGRLMLQEDLKGACAAILSFPPAVLLAAQDPLSTASFSPDDRQRAYALHQFQSGGAGSAAKKALDNLPRKYTAERAVLEHLAAPPKGKGGDQSGDWQGALGRIPRGLRMMYGHAYQSFVWNHVAGERWRRNGRAVVEGDLVILKEGDAVVAGRDVAGEGSDPDVQPVELDEAGVQAQEDTDGEPHFVRARPLSKEEAESGRYSIFDVVLPTPGFDVVYPTRLLPFYQQLMGGKTGGGLDPLNMRRKWKDISLSGNYRHLVGRVGGGRAVEDGFDGEEESGARRELMTARVRRYAGEHEQLVRTDLDRIQRPLEGAREEGGKVLASKLAPDAMVGEPEAGGKVLAEEPGSETSGDRVAVILGFRLGNGAYATMVLREMMKGGVRTN